MRLHHEITIFQSVKSKVITSLFETVRLSVSISLRNLYNSLNSIKESYIMVCLPVWEIIHSLKLMDYLHALSNFFHKESKSKKKKKNFFLWGLGLGGVRGEG